MIANLILAAPAQLLPIRIVASVALVAVIFSFIYVARHLKQIERTINADNLVPVQRGPRNNLVLMICVIPIIVVSLLAYGCPIQAIVHAYGLDERTVASWRDRAGGPWISRGQFLRRSLHDVLERRCRHRYGACGVCKLDRWSIQGERTNRQDG